jgi:hypothetical protein
MGVKGDGDYSASNPALAFSNKSDNFLITWQGDDDRSSMVDNEIEIFGQRYVTNLPLFLPLTINR